MQFTIGLLTGLIAGAIGMYAFLIASGRKIRTQAVAEAEGLPAHAESVRLRGRK